jgi:hypothetical protein
MMTKATHVIRTIISPLMQGVTEPFSVDIALSWTAQRVHLLKYKSHISHFTSIRWKNITVFPHRSCSGINVEFLLGRVDCQLDPFKTFCEIVKAISMDCAPHEKAIYAILVSNQQEVRIFYL